MKEDKDTDHFKGWPFRAEDRREDGEINNGAFDLIHHPELIDSIHEATDANGLRPLLTYLNRPDGCFMTLGCGYGYVDNGYYGYLEFTIRDPGLAMRTDWPQELEQKWHRFLEGADSRVPGIGPALAESCKMEWRRFHLRPETDQRLLITIFPAAPTEQDFDSMMSHVQDFFVRLESGELG